MKQHHGRDLMNKSKLRSMIAEYELTTQTCPCPDLERNETEPVPKSKEGKEQTCQNSILGVIAPNKYWE